MLKITKKTEYALLALGHLSRADGDEIVKVREIATTHDVPFPVLAKVMQQLRRVGLVEPVQGAQGGYRLKRDLSDVNLWQFMEQMEGPMGLVDCMTSEDCTQMESCTIQSPLQVIDDTVRQVLNSTSLEDVIRPKNRFANAEVTRG